MKSIEQRLAALEALEREQAAQSPDFTDELATLSDEDVLSAAVYCDYHNQFLWREGRPVQPYYHTTEWGAWAHGIAERLHEICTRTGMTFVPLWREDAIAALEMIERGELAVWRNPTPQKWRAMQEGRLYPTERLRGQTEPWMIAFHLASRVERVLSVVAEQTHTERLQDTAAIADWLRSLIGDPYANA